MRKPITDFEQLGNRIISQSLAGTPVNSRAKPASTRASDHHLVWITRGGGRAFIDGTQQGFGSNTAMFIPAQTLFILDLSPGTIGWQISVPSALRFPLPDLPFLTNVQKPLSQALLSKSFGVIHEEFNSKQPMRGTALIYATGMLAVQFQRLDTSNNRKELQKDTAKRRLMRRFITQLDKRYFTTDTVKDYAKNLGVTTTHLTRVCRETAGKPATRLIQEKSMEEAKFLLQETNQKIGEIASELGYATPAYFTRVFSDRIGFSPKNYRKMANATATKK
ncbi:MAG: helix-turn-helix domain-containing protein [Rhodobacteraceae bacterium]|nr:helix-turn-helix domain-containing protein [Paracoccaceae bacterium]